LVVRTSVRPRPEPLHTAHLQRFRVLLFAVDHIASAGTLAIVGALLR